MHSQEYLSGDARVSLENSIRLVRDTAPGERSVHAMDVNEFRRLYVTMLGGVSLF